MTLLITVLHVMACLILISVVLLQKGSGTDMGAAFGGGSSQSVFGASGGGSFMGKFTAGVAAIFLLSSMTLTFISTKGSNASSVMDGVKAPTAQEQKLPAAPELPLVPKEAKPVENTGSKPIPVE
ncbi:protein translocase subunit secG [Magnetococcus marinus MC-1]|uniref:Protein-export membrane protein SecG n=1 Tax=Magnetococcus marinus (strain ATCC BAA-1437 / JCM 17883 / MC-1) TaxID=156889 RepID=A0L8U9_MAGMM|nr:preprotein translocase subunit SecG [Magnetococcus marinus]ABK44392.1 protein translocase subunit secG [Magnetococcus marinus MC-1]